MSLFGGATTATTGGLFGTQPGATTTPAPGNLFGNTTTTTPATTATTATTAITAAPATGGLFGGAASTATPAATSTLNLFGPASTQPKPSLFGSTTTTQPATTITMAAPATGLFGGGAPAAAPAGSTGGLFGGAASAAQNNAYGAQSQQQTSNSLHLNMNEVRGTTKFEDLSKDAQDGIIKIDNIISVIMGWKAEIEGFLPGHEEQITSLGHDVAYLERKYAMVKRAVLEEDVANIQELRTMSNKNISDAQLVTKAVENLKLPASYHVPGLWTQSTAPSATPAAAGEPDLISYFNNHIESLGERERKLRGYITEIQGHMPRVEHGLYEKLTQLQATPGMGHQAGALEQIKGVLLDLRGAIVKQAVEVAKTREALMTLEQKMLGRERY